MSAKRIFPICLIVLALVVLWYLREPIACGWKWISDRQAVSEAIQGVGIWGPLILFLLFVLQTFLAFIPGQALMVASGYIYGFTGGLLITWFSLVVGGQAAFCLSRRYGRSFAEKWNSSTTLKRWNKLSAGCGVLFFALSLVLPIFPNDAMCYVAGLGRISGRRFLAANMLGRFLASLIAVALGVYGWKIPWQAWFVVGGLLALVLIAWRMVVRFAPSFLKGGSHVRA